jgi:hypothetical protein
MDPVTISVNLATLIGVAVKTAEGIKKLWRLREAKKELEAVQNEESNISQSQLWLSTNNHSCRYLPWA